MTKKDNENKDNLLQMAFDWIWYKIFPEQRIGTISQEELEEVFPTLPERIEYKLPSKEDKKEFRIPLGQTFRKKNSILEAKFYSTYFMLRCYRIRKISSN